MADDDKLGRIPIGRKPASRAEAWWALSREAKAILAEQRLGGRFGGTPGMAPYWYSQEVGNPAALIEAQHYIQISMLEFRENVGRILEEYLRA